MKKILSLILSVFCLLPVAAIRNIGMTIPEGTRDIISSDTLSYAVFIIDKFNVLNPEKLKASVYSLETEKELWSTWFNPRTQYLSMGDAGLFLSDWANKKTKLFDYTNGKVIRKFKATPTIVDENRDFLIGYQGKGNDKLIGYRISSGEQLWRTNIEKNYGEWWSLVKQVDSVTNIVHGGHIWKLNLLTGELHEYKLRSRIFDKKTNAINIGLSVLTTLAGMPVGYNSSYFKDLGSKVLLDNDDRMYVADRDGVMCLDNDLNEIWRYCLPEGSGSRSELYLRGDTLDMLNAGTGTNFRGDIVKVGKPFFASFDKNTGRNINILKLVEEFDKERYGDFLYFVSNPIYRYYECGNKYEFIPHKGDCYPVKCMNGELVFIDNELNILETLPEETVFYGINDSQDEKILVGTRNGKFPYYVKISSEGLPIEGWYEER